MSAAAAPAADVIYLVDSEEEAPRASSGDGAGPSRRAAPSPSRRRPAAAEVVDLTGTPDLEVVSSTVARAAKRPRATPRAAARRAPPAPAPAPPPPPAEPPGPKCGICMEAMGGGAPLRMWAGPCGHVYCHGCLVAAVKTHKRCPTCRKNLAVRQLHQVYINFST
jgi:hypothetical protein